MLCSHLWVKIAVSAVQRHKQHARVLIEDLLRAIAMMDLHTAIGDTHITSSNQA
jgi:hypothetical protein